MAETGGVEDGAGAEDALGGEAGKLSCVVGHDIHGIGDHEDDAIEAAGHDLVDHAF